MYTWKSKTKQLCIPAWIWNQKYTDSQVALLSRGQPLRRVSYLMPQGLCSNWYRSLRKPWRLWLAAPVEC